MSLFSRYGTNDVISNESAEPKVIDPIKQLYLACESISTEAAEMGNIAGYFARSGANLSMSLKRGFELLTTYNYAPLATLYPANMATIMRTVDYLAIQDQVCPQPRGFSGNLHDYVMGMAPRLTLAVSIQKNVIAPAMTRLGYYVTNAAERGERRDFPGGAADIAQIGKLLAEEAKYFKNDNSPTATFGQLFQSNSDFIKAEVKMVEYGKLLAASPPAAVRTSVEQLVSVAEGLFKSLSSDRDPASKQLIQTIGNELATVAKWVEWYAVQITRLTETNQVFSQLEKELRY